MTVTTLLEECGVKDIPEFVAEFTHAPNPSVRFGPGVLSLSGKLIRALEVENVLVVTDPGIAAAGHLDRLCEFLRAAKLTVHTFTQVEENPTTAVVDACVEAAQQAKAQAIVGIGGGSSMDAAKGCNFILTNGGKMADYWGIGKATKPMLPFIAIPTTAGTGSECQSFALISDEHTHVKMACGDRKAAASIVLLDPELTLTQPTIVARHTGVDALTHALESAVCNKATPISQAYSKAAFALLAHAFPRVLETPKNLHSRSQMLLGAALAGIAIENSMLGAAHACANPLTAQFGVVHGEAVGVMMPAVLQWNQTSPEARAMYDELGKSVGITGRGLSEWFSNILSLSGQPQRLRHWKITESHLEELATQASKQWTVNFNPVPVNALELYRSSL